MPLNASALATDLADRLRPNPPNEEAAAAEITAAYYTYCGDGLFGTSVPALVPAMRDAMASTIAGLMIGTIADFVGAFDTALATFWGGVEVTGGSGSGSTAPPTVSISTTTLTVAMAPPPPPTVDAFAAELATALDTISKSVIATLTIPPAGPVPFNFA